MRLAPTWLDALFDDAFAFSVASPTRTHGLTVDLALFFKQRGLLFGAPTVRKDESLRRETGGLAPLVRFLVTLVDGARVASTAVGIDDASGRRALSMALASLVDDEKSANTFADVNASEKAKARAFSDLGAALRRRRLLFGNPIVGLTLIYGLTAVDAAFVLDAMAQLMVGGTLRDLTHLRARAEKERVLVTAEIARLSRDRAGQEIAMEVSSWQVKNLGLARTETRRLHEGLDDEFDAPALIASLDDVALRRVLHAVSLVVFLDGVETVDERSLLHRTGESYGLKTIEVNRIRRRAARFVRRQRAMLDPLEKAVGFEIDGAPVSVRIARMMRISSTSIMTEMRETGDLAVLLAKRAALQTLTGDEHARMWDQLKDVARVVPTLAVFTLPGGAFLLPLLYRFLPFELRPSAFRPGRFRAFDDGDDTISDEGSLPSSDAVAKTEDT